MAEAELEANWDFSNNIMAAVVNAGQSITSTIVAVNGGKPRNWRPINYAEINPLRK